MTMLILSRNVGQSVLFLQHDRITHILTVRRKQHSQITLCLIDIDAKRTELLELHPGKSATLYDTDHGPVTVLVRESPDSSTRLGLDAPNNINIVRDEIEIQRLHAVS